MNREVFLEGFFFWLVCIIFDDGIISFLLGEISFWGDFYFEVVEFLVFLGFFFKLMVFIL